MFNRCTITSWNISNSLDQNKTLSKKALEHCDTCERCAQFYQQSKLLQVNLSRKAEANSNSQRSQQIIDAVHRAARAEKPTPGLAWPAIQFKWLAPVAAVLLVGVGTYLFQTSTADPHQSEMANLQEDIQTLTNFVQSASEPLKIFASK